MRDALAAASLDVTVHLLVAGLVLVGLGSAGVPAGLPVVLGLAAVAVVLFALRQMSREWLRSGPGWLQDEAVDRFLRDAWMGPALAVVVQGVYLGASAGEVQTLGGLFGLVALFNHFLRPVYLTLVGYAERLSGRASTA